MLITLEEIRELGVSCPCVSKHVPLPTQFHKHHVIPKYLGGTDTAENLLILCPTTHYNIHSLLQKYARYKGTPPGSVRKHYSDFVQRLAKQAWDGRATRRGTSEGTDNIVDPWWEEQVNGHDSSPAD